MAKNEKKNDEALEKVITEADIDRMAKEAGERIKSEKKVSVKIQKDPLNPKDGVVPVCINGYFYQIKRGEKVEVPETVADILENAGYI